MQAPTDRDKAPKPTGPVSLNKSLAQGRRAPRAPELNSNPKTRNVNSVRDTVRNPRDHHIQFDNQELDDSTECEDGETEDGDDCEETNSVKLN